MKIYLHKKCGVEHSFANLQTCYIIEIEKNARKEAEQMDIRNATAADLDAIAEVEARCFPEAEAATRAEFAESIKY